MTINICFKFWTGLTYNKIYLKNLKRTSNQGHVDQYPWVQRDTAHGNEGNLGPFRTRTGRRALKGVQN